MRSRFGGLLGALLFAAAVWPAVAADVPGRFDYYLLALTWSPGFCAGTSGRNAAQCRDGAPRGFVLHGLWPQNEDGSYPAWCAGDEKTPPGAIVADMLALTPDAGLIRHEWRKHGTCSGLGAAAYFAAARRAVAAVAIPAPFQAQGRPLQVSAAEVEAAFAAVNRGLDGQGMAVRCKAGALTEVHICLTREFAFRRCGASQADTCR